MGRLFGTDGIRGRANADLSAELALDVGRAVARAASTGVLGQGTSARPRVVVGRDTRPSGPLLEAALVAGLASAGADVLLAGVVPTAAVAFLVAGDGADAGVVLSASHNPAADNGIKVFGPGGWKPSEIREEALEQLIGQPAALPAGVDVGSVRWIPDARERYLSHLEQSVTADLRGLKVVVDCAHGAACGLAPEILRRLGVEVAEIHGEPDGAMINDGCGATHPEVVAAAAAESGSIGLTHDGDADRVLAGDESGAVVDGDAILAILASRLRRRGRLTHDMVAVTVMANQALRAWSAREGISLVETPVGDRHVLDAMRTKGIVCGGEQSGHILRLDLATTGDGILTALGLLEAVAEEGGRLEGVVPFRPFPQVLLNVRTSARDGLGSAVGVLDAVRAVEARLGDQGRVLVRASGTEPLVRVMVEAATEADARSGAEAIAAMVHRDLNGHDEPAAAQPAGPASAGKGA
ncbi:MAG TPA: phosphoglucosamine mutase [Actinomycetota bacterium]|nr:phosphoglucosamine mutase [Actinomycetota bacterium]